MIAPDASSALREEYIRRTGLAAAYREAAGITNPDQAVSLEPHGNPELEARMPRAIRDVLSDLNVTVPFACVAARAPGVPHPPGQPLT